MGGSKGYAYFFDGNGWTDDGITGGGVMLIRAGDEYDIVYTDSTSRTISARGYGFRVLAVPQPQREFTTVISIHPTSGVVEHYLFRLDDNGVGEVVWGSVKGGGGLMPKSGLYRAACSRP